VDYSGCNRLEGDDLQKMMHSTENHRPKEEIQRRGHPVEKKQRKKGEDMLCTGSKLNREANRAQKQAQQNKNGGKNVLCEVEDAQERKRRAESVNTGEEGEN